MVNAALSLYGLITCCLLAIVSSTVWWMLYAWRRPETRSVADGRLQGTSTAAAPSFSLLVPARHEQDVLAATLERLGELDYPDFEVIVVVGHDDLATQQVAYRASASPRANITVVIDNSWPKSKPKALNSGLSSCTKEIVGVFDAEDEVSLDILRQVGPAFAEHGADIVQAGVQLVTFHDRWFSLRNCLEYLFWFRSRIHAHARKGIVPLGGNTVFFRRELLEQYGGWDGECLAEDCEIGIRLCSRGARAVVSYDPRFATREETPASLRAFVRQRTRWSQGYIQVFRRGHWRMLPTRRQRMTTAYILLFPVLQGLAGLFILASVVTIAAVKMPLELAMFTSLPALAQVIVVCLEAAGLAELCRTFYLRCRWYDYLLLVVTAIPYQLVLAFAAARATWREVCGDAGWEKTVHVGAHRAPAAQVLTAPARLEA
ncbi:MAG TPA: glycosyltransferase [Acidimicrobiales bacterium]|nr:glycosyltransferase [Acidimicrobiales bacterium]